MWFNQRKYCGATMLPRYWVNTIIAVVITIRIFACDRNVPPSTKSKLVTETCRPILNRSSLKHDWRRGGIIVRGIYDYAYDSISILAAFCDTAAEDLYSVVHMMSTHLSQTAKPCSGNSIITWTQKRASKSLRSIQKNIPTCTYPKCTWYEYNALTTHLRVAQTEAEIGQTRGWFESTLTQTPHVLNRRK